MSIEMQAVTSDLSHPSPAEQFIPENVEEHSTEVIEISTSNIASLASTRKKSLRLSGAETEKINSGCTPARSMKASSAGEAQCHGLSIVDEYELPTRENLFMRNLTAPIMTISSFFKNNKKQISKVMSIVFYLGITASMIAACSLDLSRAMPLLVVWSVVASYVLYAFFMKRFGDSIGTAARPFLDRISEKWLWIKWGCIAFIVAGLSAWIALDTSKRPEQLISCGGYFVFFFGLFATSKYPDRVIWRPVLWGTFIQVCLGMLVLRTQAGYDAFSWIAMFVQTVLHFSDAGAQFVFGSNFYEHFFAFKVLPTIIFSSSFISILYYLGVMQWLVQKLAWLLRFSIGTSATETLVAVGNIFIGQTESPLFIRPYIEDLTTSEMHTVMTAGFGTIAGILISVFANFGIQPVYLVSASVMAAPCVLTVSKLFYPETKKSKSMDCNYLLRKEREKKNIIEAAFIGASEGIPLAFNIAGNVMAFLSLLAAINSLLGWFGGLFNYPQLNFELICSYVFMPISFLMGIEWSECFKAGELIGIKIFTNEYIAFDKLGVLIRNRDNGTIPKMINGELQWVDERTEAIVTYAMCGFGNVGSIGIILGGLSVIAPKRQSEMARIVVRALVAGIFVCILNACVAGFLYVPRPIVCTNIWDAPSWTNTDRSRLFDCCSRSFDATNSIAVMCKCCKSFNNDFSFCNSINVTSFIC